MASLLGYLPTSPSSAWAGRVVERLTKAKSDRLSALHANMCMSTIHLSVVDIIDEWQADAIPVLASAADDFMTLVEDKFLTSEVPAGTDEETVRYEAVRRELGLGCATE